MTGVPAQLGAAAQLDRGVERIHVDVHDDPRSIGSELR